MDSFLMLVRALWRFRWRKVPLTAVGAAVLLVGGVVAAGAVLGDMPSTLGSLATRAEAGDTSGRGIDAGRSNAADEQAARTAAADRAGRSRAVDQLQGIDASGDAARLRAIAEARAEQQADRRTERGAARTGAKRSAAGQAPAGKAGARGGAGKAAAGSAAGKATGKARRARPHRRPAWVLPLASYHLTGRFGQSGSNWAMFHHGLDFAAPTGTPIHAVGRGTIVSAGWDGAYGNCIQIRHPDGTETLYGHMSRFRLTTGQVQPGTVIGYVGATGNVTGPHVHLEVRPHGGGLDDAVDPFPWLIRHGLHP